MMFQVHWPADDECSTSASGGMGGTAVVTVSDMQGSFFLLFIGCFLGLISLVVECMRWKKQEEKEMMAAEQAIKPFVA